MNRILIFLIITLFPLSLISQDTLIWKKRIIHLGTVKTLQVNPHETMIAHNVNNIIHLRDTSGNYIIDIDFSENNINAIEFLSDEIMFFPSFEKSTKTAVIFGWDINNQDISNIFEPEPLTGYNDVIDIAVSSDNTKLAAIFTFDDDGIIKYRCMIWDINTLEILYNQVFNSNSRINKIMFIDNKLYLDDNNEIIYFDLDGNSLEKPYHNEPLLPKSDIKDFALNGERNKIASVDFDGLCTIWDLNSNKIIKSFIPIENTSKLSLVEWGRNDDYLIIADNSKHYITKYGFNEQGIVNSFIDSDSTIFDFKISDDKERLYFCDGINVYKLKLDYRKAISVIDKDIYPINIYPNPCNDFLVVDFPVNENFELQIIDVLGKVVYENKYLISHAKIDLSNLNFGTYIVKIKYENNLIIKKIIKN